LDQRANFGTALDLMQRSAGLMALFVPGHEFQETQNKIEAFRLFAFVDKELNLPKDRLEALPAMAARAGRLGNYRSIWAMEGVAHYYTAAAVPERRLHGLLADPELPETAMVPMHAGMGTAYAGYVLNQLGGAPSEAELREAMKRFFGFCRENSRDGWYENAVEPMGLAVRTLHPRLMAQVSDAMGALDGHARQLFWHGAGRSLYFVPTNFATFGSAHQRALRSAVDEAPGAEERRNTVAGLVWAVTLVNVRHPAILKNLLRASQSIDMPEAVMNGITSALMIWRHMAPGDAAFFPQYLRLQDPAWNERVAGPAMKAFADVYPELLRQGSVAPLFAYRGAHE
jgi:hypothetical protein